VAWGSGRTARTQVAAVAVALCSPGFGYVTGQIIDADVGSIHMIAHALAQHTRTWTRLSMPSATMAWL
jgi:enoyl-[acyl-carrier-protein] reductase (NADH)